MPSAVGHILLGHFMTRNVERADTRACKAETEDEDEKSVAAPRLTKLLEVYSFTKASRV